MECNLEHHASTYSFLTYTIDSWDGVKGHNFFFLKVVMLLISNKMEWNIKHYANTKSVLTHSIDPWVGSKIKPCFSESSHDVYEINGNGA